MNTVKYRIIFAESVHNFLNAWITAKAAPTADQPYREVNLYKILWIGHDDF